MNTDWSFECPRIFYEMKRLSNIVGLNMHLDFMFNDQLSFDLLISVGNRIQLIEFLVSDYLLTWSTNEDFENSRHHHSFLHLIIQFLCIILLPPRLLPIHRTFPITYQLSPHNLAFIDVVLCKYQTCNGSTISTKNVLDPCILHICSLHMVQFAPRR